MKILTNLFIVLLMIFCQMHVKILIHFVNVQNGITLRNWIIFVISADFIMTCWNIMLNLTILAGEKKFPKSLEFLICFLG